MDWEDLLVTTTNEDCLKHVLSASTSSITRLTPDFVYHFKFYGVSHRGVLDFAK